STEPLSHEPNRIARSPAPLGAGVAPWTLPPALPPAAEWLRYLAAALRFQWVVLGVTLACTALGVLVSPVVLPSYYASATVLVQEGSVGDSVGAAIGFVWVPPAKVLAPRRRVAFSVTAPYEATGRLAKELKVSADLDGNFLRMALGGTNPALIAATVNAVADR